MKRILSLLLALLLPLCAAAEAIVWTDETYIAFSEPHGYSLINVGPACSAQVGTHRYLFLKSVKAETRERIIRQSETALTALAACGAADRAYTIHVVKGSYAPRAEADTLYIGTSAYASADYVTGLAKLVYGNDVNYGLLYGVACKVASALGESLPAPLPLPEALAALSGENAIYLDLNYACFIAPYADEAMQSSVRSVAQAFAASLTAEEQSALLTGYSDEAFYARLNDFLLANGQPPYENRDMWGVTFHGGGDGSVRLRWETGCARYVLDSEFKDFELERLEQQMGLQSPLNEDYRELRALILACEATLTSTRDLLAPYQPRMPLTIWFENKNVQYRQSYNRVLWVAFYEPGDNTLHMGAISPLCHEYVHAIMDPTDSIMLTEECLAYYVSILLDPASRTQLTTAMEANDTPEFRALVEHLNAHLDQPLDLSTPEGIATLYEAELYRTALDPDLLDPWYVLSDRAFTTAITSTDTAMRVCFFHHLQKSHGFTAAIQAIAENDPVQLGSPSWEALVRDWADHLCTTYAPIVGGNAELGI